jgi:hypothetical protein
LGQLKALSPHFLLFIGPALANSFSSFFGNNSLFFSIHTISFTKTHIIIFALNHKSVNLNQENKNSKKYYIHRENYIIDSMNQKLQFI